MVEAKRGLLDFEDAAGLSIRGCGIKNSSGHGVNLTRCGGVFAQNRIEHVQGAGFHSLDGLGFDIDGNHISDCGDNGVMVWTSQAGRYEGSRIRNNIIEDIHNISGGDGPYGNGVSIWGSGSVRVENNKIYRCAYTAVRNNAGHDILVIGNDCKGFGEKAMYAEFGAKRATFRDNKIFDAGGGIALANAEGGTDIGVVTGNTVANLRETHPDSEFGPSMFWMTGILAERNCEIAGNNIIGPAWIGVMLGGYRENLRAEGNSFPAPITESPSRRASGSAKARSPATRSRARARRPSSRWRGRGFWRAICWRRAGGVIRGCGWRGMSRGERRSWGPQYWYFESDTWSHIGYTDGRRIPMRPRNACTEPGPRAKEAALRVLTPFQERRRAAVAVSYSVSDLGPLTNGLSRR